MKPASMLPVLCFAFLPSLLAAQLTTAIAPGITAPNGNTPFALETVAGQQELVPVHHAEITLNNHRGANVAGGLLAGPFYKPKSTTQLAGAHARTQLSSTTPVFYVVPVRDPASTDENHPALLPIELLRANVDGDVRTMQQVNFTALTGNAKKKDVGGIVEVTTEVLPSGWIKLTPKEPLPPGEYALVPVQRQANAFSTIVWDFGVDPSAPAPSDATPVASAP